MRVFTRVTRASCGLAACESEPARAAAPPMCMWGCVGGGGRRAGAVAHASAIRAWRARARSPVVAGSARFRGETGAPRAAR